MPKDKDPFDELDIDETILKPHDDPMFIVHDSEPPALTKEQLKETKEFRLPAHLSRSHKTEEDDWNYNILTANADRLRLRVGTKEMATNKRRKLYSARSYLKYVWKIQHDLPVYTGKLDDWTLVLHGEEDVWYIVALNISLEEYQWEEL